MRPRVLPFRFAAPLALALFLVPHLAEARKTVGAAIPANAPAVKLSAVLDAPARYHEKAVVLRGTDNSQCASL